jgi:hypothetical protein
MPCCDKQPIGDVLLDAAKSLPGRFADQPEVRNCRACSATALGRPVDARVGTSDPENGWRN